MRLRLLPVAIVIACVSVACGSDAGPSDSVVPSIGGSMPTTTLPNFTNQLNPAPPNYPTTP